MGNLQFGKGKKVDANETKQLFMQAKEKGSMVTTNASNSRLVMLSKDIMKRADVLHSPS